jgi:GGDEF domain-containing protein
VATKLNQVTGGGQAFRVGGEEFSILFPGKRMKDVVEPLEALREVVATSMFKVRENAERRQSSPRAPDRRASARKPTLTRKLAAKPRDGLLSVTVSIGAAEPSSNLQEVKLVIEAADKALYKAKKAGRNRVETSGSRPRAAAARGITA